MTQAGAPLIVTAQLPRDLHRWATQLRRTHFPAERNFLEAHVTLFHALPPSLEAEARGELARMASANRPVSAAIVGLRSLGRGVAIALRSPAMIALRDELAERFHGMLNMQDRHRPRLHITIQNKVTKAEADALQMRLAPAIQSRDFAFSGLALHAYEGGPWRTLRSWPFRG